MSSLFKRRIQETKWNNAPSGVTPDEAHQVEEQIRRLAIKARIIGGRDIAHNEYDKAAELLEACYEKISATLALDDQTPTLGA